MNRRQSIVALSAAALFSATARTQDNKPPRKPPPFDVLIQPATEVLLKGQACLSYCIYLLGEGQQQVATVARTVNELLVLASAVQALAEQHGKQLGGLAPLALTAAQTCEVECRQHLQGNMQIQECADACAAFIKACRQFQTEFTEFQQSLT